MLPGQLYDRLRHEYPAEPIQETPFPSGQTFQPSGVPGVQVMMGMGFGLPGRVRLSRADGTGLLLIAPGYISVSVLRPIRAGRSSPAGSLKLSQPSPILQAANSM